MNRALYIFSFLFLTAFLVFPVGYIFTQSFFLNARPSLAVYAALCSNDLVRESLLNSFLLGAVVTVLTAVIGIPLAFLFVRYAFPGKNLFRVLLFLPLIVSPFVAAIGMRQMLSRFGSLNLVLLKLHLIKEPVSFLGSGFLGIVILQTLHLFPIMVLNVSASLNSFDTSCEEASYNCGANFWTTFFRVTLPLLLPGLYAAASVVFVWSLTDLGTPLVFEYTKLAPVQIFRSLNDLNVNPAGYALVVTVLSLTLALFAVTKRYVEKRPYVTQKTQATFVEKQLPAGARLPVLAGLFLFSTLCLAPHASIILTSFSERWFFTVLPDRYTTAFYQTVFHHRLTTSGFVNSILYSSGSTVVDLFLGFSIGYILARTRFRGRFILDLLSMAPLAIPGIVIAVGYLSSFANTPLDPRVNPVPLLILSYSVRRLPYLVRSTYASFQQLSEHLEEASYNLGASPRYTFRRVVLPLVSPGLFAGGILVFAFAVLEVASSLILASRERFYPLAKVIYAMAGRLTDGPQVASAMGVFGMVLIGLAFLAASKLAARRIGEFFRIG